MERERSDRIFYGIGLLAGYKMRKSRKTWSRSD